MPCWQENLLLVHSVVGAHVSSAVKEKIVNNQYVELDSLLALTHPYWLFILAVKYGSQRCSAKSLFLFIFCLSKQLSDVMITIIGNVLAPLVPTCLLLKMRSGSPFQVLLYKQSFRFNKYLWRAPVSQRQARIFNPSFRLRFNGPRHAQWII